MRQSQAIATSVRLVIALFIYVLGTQAVPGALSFQKYTFVPYLPLKGAY